jgi:hypothetical protein
MSIWSLQWSQSRGSFVQLEVAYCDPTMKEFWLKDRREMLPDTIVVDRAEKPTVEDMENSPEAMQLALDQAREYASVE